MSATTNDTRHEIETHAPQRPASAGVTAVLAYGRVVRGAPGVALPDGAVSRATFERHLVELGRVFRIVGIHEFLGLVAADRGDARPRVLLTFDGGDRAFYDNAYPLLWKHRTPAVLFLDPPHADAPADALSDALCDELIDGGLVHVAPAAQIVVDERVAFAFTTNGGFLGPGYLTAAFTDKGLELPRFAIGEMPAEALAANLAARMLEAGVPAWLATLPPRVTVGPRPVRYHDVRGSEAWRAEIARLGAAVPAPLAGAHPTRRHVVIPQLVGGSLLFCAREGLIGHALRLRGADVTFVLCDGHLACDARTFDVEPAGGCNACFEEGFARLTEFGHRVVRASEIAHPATLAALRTRARELPVDAILRASHGGVDLAPHVFASALRYFRAGQFEAHDPAFVEIAREHLATALVSAECSRQILRALRPDALFMSHGIYATWGPWAATSAALNVPYATYVGGWRRNTLVCQHDSPRACDCNDIWPRWRDVPLTAEQERAIDLYFRSREDNSEDYFQYIRGLERDRAAFLERHGIDRTRWRRVAGLFTNVAYDSAEYRHGGVFPDMFEWMCAVVRYAANHPSVLFLVKAHPAEVNYHEWTPGAWRTAQYLAAHVGALPANVRVIPPEDRVSPYTVYELLDFGLVHTSSVGLEMAMQNLPVLSTRMGMHYDQPGIVTIPESRAQYFEHLARLIDDPAPYRPDLDLVRRYAYTMYFRKSLPFEPLELTGWEPVACAVDDLRDLAPGRFPGLDVLCDAILEGLPFAMPE